MDSTRKRKTDKFIFQIINKLYFRFQTLTNESDVQSGKTVSDNIGKNLWISMNSIPLIFVDSLFVNIWNNIIRTMQQTWIWAKFSNEQENLVVDVVEWVINNTLY